MEMIRRAARVGPSESRTTALAWTLWALAAALALLGFGLLLLDWGRPFGSSFAFRGFSGVVALTLASMGVVLASRRPENPIGWWFLAAGLLEGFLCAAAEYAAGALFAGRPWPAGLGVAWLQTWLWLPAVASATVYPVLLYPTGRLRGPRWRWVTRAATIGITLAAVGLAVAPGKIVNISAVHNPFAVHAGWDTLLLGSGFVLFVAALVLAASSLVLRSRGGSAVERLQIKWLAYAVCVVGVVAPPAIVSSGYDLLPAAASKGLADAMVIAVLGIPISIGVAILRYRLYDIDRIISRTLAYLCVTALLAGVYAAAVTVTTRVLPFSTPLAVAAATLLAVALFSPLRRQAQRTVDRRFNRSRYDAEATVAAFASRLRAQVELDSVRADLLATVAGATQPSHISVWLRGAQRPT